MKYEISEELKGVITQILSPLNGFPLGIVLEGISRKIHYLMIKK